MGSKYSPRKYLQQTIPVCNEHLVPPFRPPTLFIGGHVPGRFEAWGEIAVDPTYYPILGSAFTCQLYQFEDRPTWVGHFGTGSNTCEVRFSWHDVTRRWDCEINIVNGGQHLSIVKIRDYVGAYPQIDTGLVTTDDDNTAVCPPWLIQITL